jgi:hypothetical protein
MQDPICNRLHRVDASLPPHECNQDCEQGDRCTCAWATTATPHTEPPVPDSERDRTWRAWFWRGYIALLLAVLASVVWPWLVH